MQEKGEYSTSETAERRRAEGGLSCQPDALVLQASFHPVSDGP